VLSDLELCGVPPVPNNSLSLIVVFLINPLNPPFLGDFRKDGGHPQTPVRREISCTYL